MTTETQVAVVPEKKTISDLLGSPEFKDKLALSLPKHLTADRFARVALMCINRTPALQKCTKESLFQCFYDLSAMGLEPDGRRAHIIPYGDKATLLVDYKGLVELVMNSGEATGIHADIVCENDVFEYDMGEVKMHKIDFKQPRGEMYAVWCRIGLKNTPKPKCEVMSKAEVDAIRKRSKSSNSGPWVTDYAEMAKKTVFRRASKWVKLSPEVREALETDDEPLQEEGRFKAAKPIFSKKEKPEIKEEVKDTSSEAPIIPPVDDPEAKLLFLIKQDKVTMEELKEALSANSIPVPRNFEGPSSLTDKALQMAIDGWDIILEHIVEQREKK